MESAPRNEARRLVHPVYLDVPMMVSFLAAIEGGVAFQDESVRRTATGSDREREGSGRLGLPALGSLLGFDMSGRMASANRQDDSEEVKAVRQHTSASLFNALYEALVQEGLVSTVEQPQGLEGLEFGQLVEVRGAFVGNPLRTILDLFAQILPYMNIEEEVKRRVEGEQKKGNPRKSGNPARRAQADEILATEHLAETAEVAAKVQQEFGFNLMTQMRQDLEEATVHDTVIEAKDGLHVVLTMSAEFFTAETGEHLRAGNFTAIGKVTRVLAEDEDLNLARRTVLGAAGPEMTREIIHGVEAIEELTVEAGDPVISAPAVQVLPLAVFV